MIHLKMKNIMKSRKTTDSTRRKGRDAQADPDEDYLDQDYDDYDNEEEERIRRIKNKVLVRVSYLMVALFLSMAGYLIYFNVVLRDDINNNQYNTKQSAYQEQIIRGNIYSAAGNVLAQTDIAEDGTESRSYPYSNLFAHIVGYATNGKSGIESVHNYDLLSSHASILDQIREEKLDTKVQGDSLVLTLNTQLQQVCYDALGDNKGAIVVLEPSTGKVLAMVSKPDFDPNTIEQDWDALINDDSNSSLFNRALQGQYPPGSTFKIITALEYIREYDADSYSYHCTGSAYIQGGTSIPCFDNKAHGTENLKTAFANSCNSAFSTIGTQLNRSAFKNLCSTLMFNSNLPIGIEYNSSSFTLDDSSGISEAQETAIGQGKTMMTPIHNLMITAAIANDGVMMTPYLVDHVQTADKIIVEQTTPTALATVATADEAEQLTQYMRAVVTQGTGYALKNASYKAAGKTGSAQYDSSDNVHSWFVGFAPYDDPEVAICVILEGGYTGVRNASYVAKEVLDAYFN